MSQILPSSVDRPMLSPYQHLLHRIHRQINSSAAQLRRQTTIVRAPDENAEDWDAFLEQLDIEESVSVTRLGWGIARLEWTNQHRS